MFKAYIPCRPDTCNKAFAASCASPLTFSATYLRFVTNMCILQHIPILSFKHFGLLSHAVCLKSVTSTCLSQVRSLSSRFEKARALLLSTQLVSTVFPFCFYIVAQNVSICHISARIVSICHRGRWGDQVRILTGQQKATKMDLFDLSKTTDILPNKF